MPKPYRNFNLSTRHLAGTTPYVPPKARNKDEIDRRREVGKGTLILEQELLGIAIGELVLSRVEEQPDVSFALKKVAPAAINTAAHKVATTNDVMGRVLRIPRLRLNHDDEVPDSRTLLNEGVAWFNTIGTMASQHLIARANKSPDAAKLDWYLGKAIGGAGLALSAVPLGDKITDASPFQAQDQARIAGLQTVQACHDLADEIGTAPSLAQLADPDSDLAVHIRRTVPNGAAYEAFDEAFSTLAMPR